MFPFFHPLLGQTQNTQGLFKIPQFGPFQTNNEPQKISQPFNTLTLPFPFNVLNVVNPISYRNNTEDDSIHMKFLEKLSEFLEDIQQNLAVSNRTTVEILTQIRDRLKNGRLDTIKDLKISILDHIEVLLVKENITEKEIQLLHIFRGFFAYFFLNNFDNKSNEFKKVIIGFLKEISGILSNDEITIEEKISRLNTILITLSYLRMN
jgi:hypothetical protein